MEIQIEMYRRKEVWHEKKGFRERIQSALGI